MFWVQLYSYPGFCTLEQILNDQNTQNNINRNYPWSNVETNWRKRIAVKKQWHHLLLPTRYNYIIIKFDFIITPTLIAAHTYLLTTTTSPLPLLLLWNPLWCARLKHVNWASSDAAKSQNLEKKISKQNPSSEVHEEECFIRSTSQFYFQLSIWLKSSTNQSQFLYIGFVCAFHPVETGSNP